VEWIDLAQDKDKTWAVLITVVDTMVAPGGYEVRRLGLRPLTC